MLFLSYLVNLKEVTVGFTNNALLPFIKDNLAYFFIIGLSIISVFFILYSIKRCLSFKSSIVQSAKDKYKTDGKIICIEKQNSKKQKYVLVSYEEYMEFRKFKKQQKSESRKQSG